MTRRLILPIYAVWMTVLAVIYFWVPQQNADGTVWMIIGATSTAAILVGTHLNRPRRTIPWRFVAGAVLAYAVGDAVYYFEHADAPAVIWLLRTDDVSYLIMLILLICGLLQFGRPSRRGAALDALIVLCGVGLLTWIVLVQPNIEAAGDQTAQISSIAYPLADVVILAVVTRLVTAVQWSASVALFALGAAGLLLSDALFRLGSFGFPLGDVIGLGWFAFYLCFGAAALHPSMHALTEPPPERPREASWLNLALLGVSAILPPAVLLYEAWTHGPVRHGIVIAIVSGSMFVLVLVRLGGVGRRLRLQVDRERGLREVSARLVSAADAREVGAALDSGIAELLPGGVGYRMVLLESAETPEPLDRVRTDEIIVTEALPEPLAQRLHPIRAVLACPLIRRDSPVGDSYLGILLVGAPEQKLREIHPALTVLAGQAALAIDRVHLGQELLRRNNEEYFRALVHNTADVILILADDDRIRYASPSATAMFGTTAVTGTRLPHLVDPADRDAAAAELDRIRANGGSGAAEGDWTVRGPAGPAVQVEASWRDLRGDTSVRGIVLTLRDVTEQRRLERELTHRAYHDALTGLPNRVLFAERVQEALAHAASTQTVAGVLLLDLDDFKIVNDTLGHEHGDQLLVAVSHRLTDLLRQRDTAARLGGDEFAVVVEDAGDASAVEEIAARIVGAFRDPIELDGQQVSGSVSVGVATTADAGEGADLLRHADLALYVAKGEGKGQWRRYQPDLHTAITDRLTLRTELDAAIAGDQLVLEYQPIVALGSGATVGFEALVRWDHPTRGRLLPSAFIDLAEESGLVVPMGDWVLRTAVAAAFHWRRLGVASSPYISANVSASQFRKPGFADRVMRELTAGGLAPHCLMLEITESLLLRDDEQVWQDLARLRQTGVRIAIDDFGTGYSSLSYLRHVPLDVLKIDRLFTSTIATSGQQRALVDGIVRLARTLGLQVIAEGIETPAERDLLTRIGCPFGQGYLFAKPMPLAETTRWLQHNRAAA